ncbi:D-serine deaminase-like pyridoxal phosphate-dependent protein [Nocardioides ginsengisegetis]|uniref:D-serine deaminase-like pyridoxal phosphate-dependent protein n=1 Tax=Nocardioides ginsengisegetis TaxID=661491 RepID=A0A7W3IZC9_9ACTN|nr:alanine racemase [Nocardioides ginsengisegetis]MBA8803359.1 D-serine deaminase-like pyridoxal phosphate-dependent protein [Nocardioides ginsengisegetis]
MAQPATPFLRIDLVRLRANVRAMADLSTSSRVALRPHVKTHKTIEIGRLQMSSGAVGITVATIGEAETFAGHGFDDIFIAYPLWLHRPAARRLEDLASSARVAIGVDSVEGVAQASRLLGTSDIEVMVEVDSGQHRSGVRPEDAGAVADTARRAGLTVRGAFTFPGHSYAPGAGRASAAAQESAALAAAATSLRAVGIEPRVLSGGSTPSIADTDLDVVTEIRPGVYCLGDAQQWELGVMKPAQIALTCRATVVSHAGGRVVLDAGSKVLGADRAPYSTGHGRLLEHPDARIVMLAEHHAVVEMGDEAPPALGSKVDVVPNHVCAAVNLVDTLYADEAGALRAWPVAARGRNS